MCKEDEGGYYVVILKNIDYKIFSNIGFFKILGGMIFVLMKDKI